MLAIVEYVRMRGDVTTISKITLAYMVKSFEACVQR
jgi:hypothetical protein